jgi:cytoskeleton protein RodZ
MSGDTVASRSTDDRANASVDSASGLPAREPSVGEQLQAVRESRGWSVDDIAGALKISHRQVAALEADDWARLPGKTIIRGFVRNYARLLNLDAESLMATLDRMQMPRAPELVMGAGTPVNISRDDKADRRDYVRVFSGLTILILALLAYFLFPQDLWQSTLAALKTATQPKDLAARKTVASAEGEAKTAEPVAPATAVPLEPQAVPLQSLLVSEPAPAAPAANASLKFSFSKPAWVEVRDRSGQTIFSQLSQAGSQREIEGQPPFSLVIGNASHVTLQYKGKPVDLSRRSKEDVARLTLE